MNNTDGGQGCRGQKKWWWVGMQGTKEMVVGRDPKILAHHH